MPKLVVRVLAVAAALPASLDASGAFLQNSSGLASMEAEHFAQSGAGPSVAAWAIVAVGDASGQQAIKAAPGVNTTSTAQAPWTEYQVNFNRTGAHDVWIRLRSFSSATDQVYVSFDNGALVSRGTNPDDGAWRWRRALQGVAVGSLGQHTVRIYRREPTLEVDKIVVSPAGASAPTGTGPAESPDDTNGPPPPPPPPGNGAFLQDSAGLTSMEAEHFAQSGAGPSVAAWAIVAVGNASGQQAIKAAPGVNTTSTAQAPWTEYQVNFNRTGAHDVWIRLRSFSSATDQVYVNFDNGALVSRGTNPDDGVWRWRRALQGIAVGSLGRHPIRIYRQEPTLEVDKIVVTPAGASAPAGTGPAESAADPGGDPPPPPPPAPGRPNILFIFADDMGAEASELYPWLAGDHGQVPTPALRSLAGNGIVFTNAWANPVCTPTRGTIISGLYGHHTGVTKVGDVLPTSTTSIFEYVAASSPANYAMATFGKWHIGGNTQHVIDTGVPVFRGFLGGFIDDYYDWTVVDINGSSTSTHTYATTALTNFAIQFINDHEQSPAANDPWFVYLPYNAPHGVTANNGFQVPPSNLHSVNVGGLPPDGAVYNGNLAIYQAMIQALDTEIGRLLQAVGPVGSPERDNTVVIFATDNGTPSAVKDSGTGLNGAKMSVFEGGTRVPLVISGAGVTRTGALETDIVVLADLYATIAELSGIPVSQVSNSYSLVPLLTNGSASSGRQYAFTELCNANSRYAIRGERYKLSYNNGIRTLYDLVNDPLETNNLFGNPTVSAEQTILEAELATLAQSAEFGCFNQ